MNNCLRVVPQTQRASRGGAKRLPALMLWLSVFSALSCVAGGIELVFWRHGNEALPTLDALRFTPFRDYLVPGLILLLVVGGAQLACAVAVFRRARVWPLASVLAGGSLTGWIVAEAAMLRDVSIWEALFVAVGLAMLSLGIRAAWSTNEPRSRWLLLVTAGELLGFAAPALTGILLNRLGAGGPVEVVALALAGACEGLLLGAAQAAAWPLPVRRVRYAVYTALAAGLVWLCAMTLVQLAASSDVPPEVVIAWAAVTGVTGLLAIGGAQWLELRHHAPKAWRFIAWTALAWTLALPFSFAPSPFVDEATPLGSQIALWVLGGLLMAAVMALVTWRGARQLAAAPTQRATGASDA